MSNYGFWGGVLEWTKTVTKWVFPNGIGTRATLAFIVVGYGITLLEPTALKEVVIMILAFYFITRPTNGVKPPPAPQ